MIAFFPSSEARKITSPYFFAIAVLFFLLILSPLCAGTYYKVYKDTAGNISPYIDKASIIEDYGSFVVINSKDDFISLLKSKKVAVEELKNRTVIGMDSYTFDTQKTLPQLPSKLTITSYSEGKSGLYLLQFIGPIKDSWLKEVESKGIKILHYIPNYAYLIKATTQEIDSVKQLRFVQWAGIYQPAYKIHPKVKNKTARLKSNEKFGILMQIVNSNNIKNTLAAIRNIGCEIVSSVNVEKFIHLRAYVPADRIEALAVIDDVVWIELMPEYKMLGEREAITAAGQFNVGGTAPYGPGYNSWLIQKGLSGGAGYVAHIMDDGLDKGDDTNQIGTAHLDILGRISGIFNATHDPKGNSTAGHGQINAGIIMGTPVAGNYDSSGFLFGVGISPSASIYATKVFSNSGYWDTGIYSLTQLVNIAVNGRNVVVSSNSWGASDNGDYSLDSAEFDKLTRDSNTFVIGNQELTFVFAAGNDGTGTKTISSPATAKNVISVGASTNSDNDGTDGCGVSPSSSDSIKNIADFSSRGPMADNRLGPTVVSVGTHVQGIASIDPDYDGSGVCDKYWPVGQTNYARSSGTSHSTPIVAGAVVLFSEYYQNLTGEKPSPSLVKAALAASADDMAGGDDGAGGIITNIPNNIQGWGRLNLDNLINDSDKPLVNYFKDNDSDTIFGDTGQDYQIVLQSVDISKPLKIALAWTDAPGAASANPVLLNNLDLIVSDGTNTYLGNVFSNGFSISGGTSDSLNTIESVFIENPTAGSYIIQVYAANIAGNGIPGNSDSTDQDFSIVIMNGISYTSAEDWQFY